MTRSLPTNLSFFAVASQHTISTTPRFDSILVQDDALFTSVYSWRYLKLLPHSPPFQTLSPSKLYTSYRSFRSLALTSQLTVPLR